MKLSRRNSNLTSKIKSPNDHSKFEFFRHSKFENQFREISESHFFSSLKTVNK
jgi:hypothetical protein